MKSRDDDATCKDLGTRVRDYRLQQALSQEELASLAGVHRTYIGMVERGEKNVTVLTLRRIAHALGIAPAALL